MTASVTRVLSATGRVHFYRPAIETYFAGMYAAFGCSARALHVASVLVHLANVGLVMILAPAIVNRWSFAALAALLFASQPALAEAVLWPSAMTTLLCATFGLTMVNLDVRRSRGHGSAIWIALALAGALACHESAVMFVPASLVLRLGLGERKPIASWIREYLPCFVLLALYLPLITWINLRNYVVTGGHYAIGPHIGQNFLDYLVALYAGQRRIADYIFVSAVWIALLWKGSPLVGSLSLWIILALLPALPFAWGTASRYVYLPTIPFCLLVALGLLWLHDTLTRKLPHRQPIAIAVGVVLMLLIVGRSASFARKGADAFHAAAEPYRAAAAQIARNASNGTVHIDPSAVSWMPPVYVTPLARTAVCDPGLVVETR